MTSDGDGNRSNAVDPDSADSDSIDALLAELLGPDFVAPENEAEGDSGGPADRPRERPEPAHNGDVDAVAVDALTGSEDPTIALPDDLPAIGALTTESTAAGNGDSAGDPPPPDPPTTSGHSGPETAGDEAYSDSHEDGDAVGGDDGHHGGRHDDHGGRTSTSRFEEPAPFAPTVGSETEADAVPAPDQAARRPLSTPPMSKPVPISSRAKPAGSAGRLLKLGIVAVLGLYVLLVAAWGIDAARHQANVMRGVMLDGSSISGLTADELAESLEAQQQELAAEPVEVVVQTTTVSTDPAALGASIDTDEMVVAAMAIGRSGFFLARPFSWLGRVFNDQELETQYQYDAELTAGAAQSVVAARLDQPREPELVLDGSEQLIVEPGASGTTINPRELVGRLPAVIEAGPPYRIELQAVTADPTIDQGALETVAAEINDLTAEPVRIQVLDSTADVDGATLKSWTVVDTTGGGATWTIDRERALADLRPLFPALGSEDQKARFTVVDGDPIIVPASETVICCDGESIGTIQTALAGPIPPTDDESGDDGEEDAPALTITLEPTVVGFDEGVAELESLGIVEQVSTFTTNHACCQNRVRNIQRFADLMQGVIIRPGETFSLNGHVGRRTIENGFVADGAINLGVLEPQVGGGISQYATTFFNAAFYAGLEFVEYQSHSLYISRYPRGREATISWRKPDLKVHNTTPYGILVWNEYTPTSITVSFYSTKHLVVEDLPLRRSSERQCRVDITPRRITFPDGTQVEDSVYAVYRPGEGLDCNGNSTQPEEDQETPAATTTTTAATRPDPEPEPDPEPDPDPGPPTTGSESD